MKRLASLRGGFLPAVLMLAATSAAAQTVPFTDVSPDFSDTDPSDPDGATGGRVNGLAVDPTNGAILYAASEWGGIYKSFDAGHTWAHLDGHLPQATWDVEVDPSTPTRVVATSFFDGKVVSRAGINVSTDGGGTWTLPTSAHPPPGFCANALDLTEPSAFGIAFDPLAPANVFVGTSCGLAVSGDSAATWIYRDPTPSSGASRIWDVVALGNGVVHVCGDDGHLRSDDGGATWVAGTGLSSGRCSLAVSPDEPWVLLAVVGTTIFESDDANAPGGATWAPTRTNLSPQGRIPFVATNQRSDVAGENVFDLWFGDVRLFRVSCTTPALPAPGGAPRCGSADVPPWAGPFTRAVGGHDDTGAILFDPAVSVDACPILYSCDGGVYRNTDASSDCHNPNWEQPDLTPHGLWPFSMGGADRAGSAGEDLYFGNQDNGVFGSIDAGSGAPDWHNDVCCDGFDTQGDPSGGVYTVCCFGGGGRSTRARRTAPGFVSSQEITYPPGGLLPSFKFADSFQSYDGNAWVSISRDCTPGNGGCQAADGGVFVTPDIRATPIVWTELGNATEPPSGSLCGITSSLAPNGVPTFYAMTGDCNSNGVSDRVFRFTGTDPSGTWSEISLPSGGFGVFAVDPSAPLELLASGLTATDGGMWRSHDGGDSWKAVPQLDALMTGGGNFAFRNRRGPSQFTGFNGYWQPSLVAFDGASAYVVAGGQDSGLFLSTDDGETWSLLSDPFTSDLSGTPHLPRPRYAYFDDEPGGTREVYIGSQGRGIWRVGLPTLLVDGFESGDTSLWSSTVP